MSFRVFASSTILILSVWAFSGARAVGQSATETPSVSTELARVTAAMQSLVDRGKVAGAVIMVSHQGETILFDAVGSRSVDTDQPMSRDTIVRIYSMTKPITTAAAMMLVEHDKLALDDPVEKYLPELAGIKVFTGEKDGELQLEPTKRPMTIRDLMRHTSGLTYGIFGDTPVDRRYRTAGVLDDRTTLSEMVTRLSEIPLLDQPGTRFNYSVATDVLGRVVEVVSDQSLDAFFRDRIFEPLEMRDTAFHVPKEKLQRFAANHGLAGDRGLKVTDRPQTSRYRMPRTRLSGGGGLVSTASDYMTFCRMMLGGGELSGKRLLKESSVAQMTRNQLPDRAYPIGIGGQVRHGVGFGLGFSVIVEKTDYTAVNHIGEYGWGGAASTHFWISPRDELAVVALTQQMPFTMQLEAAVKPLIYEAIK